ncbi:MULTISPECIES: DISARM system phospholipase D-like protein DrmC [Nostocales]|uniref:DISARM system phospholipase D-like protein DrmC n=1 Tax=Tolypothrix campylonemoides VB511288_2 TaxID=3232311 RepID=A0ABW8XPH0_9CYAN
MNFLSPPLLAQIRTCAKQLPRPVLETLIELLATGDSKTLKASVLTQLPNPNFRRVVADLLDAWSREGSHVDGSAMPAAGGYAIAAALMSAAYCEQAAREELSVELVWTGPSLEGTRLRRTQQVLLQLIQDAKQELILVSFAVYKIPEIAKALVNAIERGISLKIIAETPESGEGKIPFGVGTTLGMEIARKAQLYIWPRHKRLTDSEGRYGSLHIKCVVCDRQHLFVSSANLTEYALTLNMEMGVLIHSEDLACQVVEHMNDLIQQETLMLYFE